MFWLTVPLGKVKRIQKHRNTSFLMPEMSTRSPRFIRQGRNSMLIRSITNKPGNHWGRPSLGIALLRISRSNFSRWSH